MRRSTPYCDMTWSWNLTADLLWQDMSFHVDFPRKTSKQLWGQSHLCSCTDWSVPGNDGVIFVLLSDGLRSLGVDLVTETGSIGMAVQGGADGWVGGRWTKEPSGVPYAPLSWLSWSQWQEHGYLSHYHSPSWAQMSFPLYTHDAWKALDLLMPLSFTPFVAKNRAFSGVAFDWFACQV